MTSVILKGLLPGAFSFCVSAHAAAPDMSRIAGADRAHARQRMPATQHTSYTAVLTFKAGSNEISKTDQAQLEAVFAQMKERSQKVEEAHVAAWGDAKVVAAKTSAPVKDRTLADARADAVEDLLEHTFSLTSVETYSMSERGNWFSRALSLQAAEIKKLFANAGAPQTVTPEDFAIVKTKGGASRVVVLIEVDPTSVAVE